MYNPVLGRFLSRDPLSSTGVDLLTDSGFYSERLEDMRENPWEFVTHSTNPYNYCENNPTNRIDPSGLQSRDPKCCACDMAADHHTGTRYEGPRGQRCIVTVHCDPNGCGPNHLPGFTDPPRPQGNNEFHINICLSCALQGPALDAAIAHELIHAQRFCRSEGIHNCRQCKLQERAAYEVSCKIAFPNDPKKQARCIDCGVKMSCQGWPSPNGKGPCTIPGDCTLADLGIPSK